jgi:uncharacterized protein (TIGR03000 family)
MYSVVLLMAISGGADVPAAHHGHGCAGYAGCAGCAGAVYTGCAGCSGGAGCHGGGHQAHHRQHRGHGCNGGCYGGCYGGAYAGCTGGAGCYGGAVAPVAPGGAPPKEMPKPGEKPKEEASISAPATIIVSLPAEAKLTIDDATTTSTGAVRTFVSPTLNAGRDYNYTLKTEIAGQTISKLVTVRAGEETKVELSSASIASK